MTSSQTCIIVLGAPRSGTSLLTGVLYRLGVELGHPLKEADPMNQKGFYEHSDILDLNERILQALNSHWGDIFPLKERWWNEDNMKIYIEEVAHIIQRNFKNIELFGI